MSNLVTEFLLLRYGFHLQLVSSYPFLSKTLREAGKPQKQRSHCCGVVLQNQGIGYEDLNQLIKEPCNLAFTIGKYYFVIIISITSLALQPSMGYGLLVHKVS
jgi:hypothetical protein